MDFLRSQLLRIQQQLGTLTASQKMLTATLVAIMVMTLVLWSRYSGEAEMQPLLDQNLSLDEIAGIKSHLSLKNVSYRVEGDRVLVPADRRFEILADLSYAKVLPRNTQTGFNEMIKQMGMWVPESQKKEMWNKYKEMTLARVIGELPGVKNAVVIIDPNEELRFGNNRRQSTATVSIETTTPDQRPSKALINAAADIVAGAQAGLMRSKISVIIDGVATSVQEKDDASLGNGTEYIQIKHDAERQEANRIAEHLNIPNAHVAVTVSLTTDYVQRREQRYDPKGIASKEKTIRDVNAETTAPPMPAQETGVGANVQVAIPSATGGGDAGGSTESETETENEIRFSQTYEETKITPGKHTIVSASVRVPRSYFVNIIKAKDPSMTDPTDAVLQPVIAEELPKIREAVKVCTYLKNDEDVVVQDYIDVMPMLATVAGPQTAGTGVASMLTGYTKEIVVGALAVVSLFMVMMMVRKGAPAPVMTIAPEPKVAPQLVGGEDVAGEVSEGNAMLDGMELDEDAVKTQQMLDQVTTMVQENPDAAANLVKRWLNRS